MSLKYNGSVFAVNEVKEYFVHVSKARRSVVESFFKHVEFRLGNLGVEELGDFLHNYYHTFNVEPKLIGSFLKEIFGIYHYANSLLLIDVLNSFESKDKSYYSFKEEHIKENISKLDKNLAEVAFLNKDIDVHSVEYKRNLENEIFYLERKKEYLDKLEQLMESKEK